MLKVLFKILNKKLEFITKEQAYIKTLTPRLKFPHSMTFFMAGIFSCNDQAARIIVPNCVFPIEVRPLLIPHSVCANFSSAIAGWDL